MSVMQAVEERPEESKMSAFRSFSGRLFNLEKQFEKGYHTNRFLRDKLLSVIDIPEIQSSVRDRTARKAHQFIKCVTNHLSKRQGS